MKISMFAALLSMTICFGISACVTEEPTDDVDPSSLSEVQQGLDCHPAVVGCIETAIRDGNYWLIDTCIEVLCQSPAQQ